MNFFLNDKKSTAVNLSFVKSFGVGQVVYDDEKKFCVAAVFSDETNKIVSRDFDTDDEAKKFLAELVENLNDDNIKFLLDCWGNTAVNFAFVKSISVERVIYRDGGSNEVHVAAEYSNEPDVTLKIFDAEDAEKNYKAAEKYLTELVEKINGGTK